MKEFDMFWRYNVSDPNCDHEPDFEAPMEGLDLYEYRRFGYNEAATVCVCKHCGGTIHCVDDTGVFGLTEDGYFV